MVKNVAIAGNRKTMVSRYLRGEWKVVSSEWKVVSGESLVLSGSECQFNQSIILKNGYYK